MIEIKLQQAPGMVELGNKMLQQSGVVQIAQQGSKPEGMTEQGKEVPAGLRRRKGLGKMDRFTADDLPGLQGNRLIVEIGQIDEADNGG